jgi:K+-sensing histidine kinase KdpD
LPNFWNDKVIKCAALQGVAYFYIYFLKCGALSIMETKTDFEIERIKLQRKVLSSVAHDFRTPLACIIGSLEVYKRTKDSLPPETIEALINTALKEAHRMDGFITEIFDEMKQDAVIPL